MQSNKKILFISKFDSRLHIQIFGSIGSWIFLGCRYLWKVCSNDAAVLPSEAYHAFSCTTTSVESRSRRTLTVLIDGSCHTWRAIKRGCKCNDRQSENQENYSLHGFNFKVLLIIFRKILRLQSERLWL